MAALRPVLFAGALVACGAIALAAIPSLNPFHTETIDRSGPAVLKSIERLTEYHAATANLQQVVEIEEDAPYLPSFIKGSKSLLLASGKVDAVVDFSSLGTGAVDVSDDHRSATIRLPAPTLAKPQLDLERSKVYNRDRGLVDRVESVFEDSPTEDGSLLLVAQKKLTGAAAADGGVLTAARTNTRAMLTELLHGLGFTNVTVRFDATPAT